MSLSEIVSEVKEIPKSDINLPKKKKGPKPGTVGKIVKHKGTVDTMIAEGETMTSMANEIHVTKQAIEQYILRTDQYEKWKKVKVKKRELKKELRKELVDILLSYLIKRGVEEDVEEAVVYYFRRKKNRKRGRTTSLENLIGLVKIYKDAKDEGSKLTYRDISELCNIKGPGYVGGILKDMGLKSFHWNVHRIPRKKFSQDKKAILRGLGRDLDYLSNADIAYFLGVSRSSIGKYRPKDIKNKNGITSRTTIKVFGRYVKGKVLTYKIASQIYGFKDEFRSSIEEIADVIEKSTKIVSYALEHRREIEPRLIYALRKFYPHENITKPYR